MNIELLVPLIVAIISSIVGPLVMFFVGKRYTEKYTNGVIRQNNKSLEGVIEKNSKNLEKKIEQHIDETIIGDHAIALDRLNATVMEHLDRRIGAGKVELELKLIAVAMTYSWEFIDEKLRKILEQDEYYFARINLKVAFVDGNYLSKLKIERSEKDWGKISLQREQDIPGYKKRMAKDFPNKFTCEFHTYQNIPHWHGWLVKETFCETDLDKTKYLFLGRTRWEHKYPNNQDRKRPKLTVGQNEYRYYTNNTGPGVSRIDLFEQWHTYYFERAPVNKIGSGRVKS